MEELVPTLSPPLLPPPAGTTMNDLPNEILFKILSNVDDRSRRNAVCVSNTWHTVIDEMIGRVTFIGRPCQFVPQDEARYTHKYVDIQAISELGVNECYFGEVVDPSTTMTLLTYLFSTVRKALYGDTQTPQFKYPHLVKTLHFDGPVPNQYFESMLQDLVNLTKVELHMTAFTCLHSSALQSLRWHALKWLKIWGHRLIDGMFTAFYPTQEIVPNLHLILTNVFPSLTHFSIECPFDIRDERSLIQRVFSFMRSHPRLFKFRVCINLAINTDDTPEFEMQSDREWFQEAKAASRALRLKVLELIVSNMRRARLARLWMGFVEQQRTLESVTILSFRIPLQMVSSITDHNGRTLRKLFMSRIMMSNNGRNLQLDCSAFANCLQLSSLTLEGMLTDFTEPGLTSVRLLPVTLTHLEIGGLPLLHTDTQGILFGLPLLSNVCLTDVGSQGPFGVTVDTMWAVVLDKRIAVVTIYRSICGEFPATGIPNGDPSSATFVNLRPYDILEIKLNETGYYENMLRHSVFDDLDDD